MSSTKRSMLSTTHAIFRGLQEQIKDSLRTLPTGTSPNLVQGLTEAHRKLSDYYYKFDESPLYTWATLLDPRISYSGMLLDYADNSELLDYLENAKAELHTHFEEKYKSRLPTPTTFELSSSVKNTADNTPVVNFMARYRQAPRAPANELDEYFKLS
ncbi:hypothetical protein H0H92_013146, partial [Tricholoma furcatifolium]